MKNRGRWTDKERDIKSFRIHKQKRTHTNRHKDQQTDIDRARVAEEQRYSICRSLHCLLYVGKWQGIVGMWKRSGGGGGFQGETES